MKRESIPIESARDGAILVGNGINRLGRGPSWEELLISLADNAELPNDGYELDLEKPFPLLYEELVLRGRVPPRDLEKVFAKEVQKFSSELEPNAIHERIRSCGVRHIITTNYDLTIESPYDSSDLKNRGVVRETKYSVFRRFDIRDEHYWHIHGDVKYKSSIMLGYDHYAGALEQMRKYVTSSASYENYNREGLISRIDSHISEVDSWIDLFFTTDIHILGLGLDTSEMHLWWLINYRERSRRYHNIVDGDVRYYTRDVQGLRRNTTRTRQLSMLESLGVEVVEIEVGHRDWEEFYHKALDRAIDYSAV